MRVRLEFWLHPALYEVKEDCWMGKPWLFAVREWTVKSGSFDDLVHAIDAPRGIRTIGGLKNEPVTVINQK